MNRSPSKEAQRRGGERSAAQQQRDEHGQFAGKRRAQDNESQRQEPSQRQELSRQSQDQPALEAPERGRGDAGSAR